VHPPVSAAAPGSAGASAALRIRPAGPDDGPALWAMLEPVFRAGETYCIERDVSREGGLAFWCDPPHRVFLAESGEGPVGTYYLMPNQRGGGAHVTNCGFVSAAAAQGRGVARAMLVDALARARADGYRAMQFNFVVETNTRAVALWQAHGFETVGRLPRAFDHPVHGMVDALILHRSL